MKTNMDIAKIMMELYIKDVPLLLTKEGQKFLSEMRIDLPAVEKEETVTA